MAFSRAKFLITLKTYSSYFSSPGGRKSMTFRQQRPKCKQRWRTLEGLLKGKVDEWKLSLFSICDVDWKQRNTAERRESDIYCNRRSAESRSTARTLRSYNCLRRNRSAVPIIFCGPFMRRVGLGKERWPTYRPSDLPTDWQSDRPTYRPTAKAVPEHTISYSFLSCIVSTIST